MAMERLWEKMEEEEGKICGRKKKGLREKEEEIPNSVLPKENRKKNSVSKNLEKIWN